MLTISKWLFTAAWLILLIIGLVQLRQKLNKISVPKPQEVSAEKQENLDNLANLDQFLTAVHSDGVLLRNFLLTGEEHYETERQNLWEETIRPLMAALVEVSVKLDNKGRIEMVQKIDTIRSTLFEIDKAEEEIVEIAFAPQNQPALDMFQQDLRGRYMAMREKLTQSIELIDSEQEEQDNGSLKDFLMQTREQLDALMADLELYLITGESPYLENFKTDFTYLQQTIQNLELRADQFTDKHKQVFEGFFPLYNEWQERLPEVTQIRQREDWNVALYTLTERVDPNLNNIAEAGAELRTRFLAMASEEGPEPGSPELQRQVMATRQSFTILIISGVVGVIAAILSLVPAVREPE